MLAGIPVFKSDTIGTHYEDGRPRMFFLMRSRDGKPEYVIVHPKRWDAFVMAINQRDVFNHPEVQALLDLE